MTSKPAFAQSSYAGYVDQSTRDSALAWAPPQGSRTFLETKYSSLAPEVRGRVQDASEKAFSVYDMQFHNVHPGDYHVPTPKLGLQVMPMYKPQVVVPEIAASYPDYHGEADMLRAVKDADIDKAVEEADYQHAGYILDKEVRMCLRTCLGGKEPSTHLAGLFNGYFARKHQTHISRNDLKHAIVYLADYIDVLLQSQLPGPMKEFRAARMRKPVPEFDVSKEAEEAAAIDREESAFRASQQVSRQEEIDLGSTQGFNAIGSSTLQSSHSKRLLTAGPLGFDPKERPSGMNLGTIRETTINSEAQRRGMPIPMPAKGLATSKTLRLVGPEPLSSYERDEGRYGSNPNLRPVGEPNIRGFHQTTKELNQGTARTSRHVAGFMGHVPASTFGPAAEQGLGHGQRDTFLGHTNLNQTFTRHVPGYSGYAPTSAINQTLLSNLDIGVKAPNETGRMQGPTTSHWAIVGVEKKF